MQVRQQNPVINSAKFNANCWSVYSLSQTIQRYLPMKGSAGEMLRWCNDRRHAFQKRDKMALPNSMSLCELTCKQEQWHCQMTRIVSQLKCLTTCSVPGTVYWQSTHGYYALRPHWIWGWVRPTAGLYVVDKRKKFLPQPVFVHPII